jgi:hypothetical protein
VCQTFDKKVLINQLIILLTEINLVTMATGWSSPTKDKSNFARLCRLLIEGGTRVLKYVFDSIHPPTPYFFSLGDIALNLFYMVQQELFP